jgi:hypothetical protein
MSFENDGLPASWEEIKTASRRIKRAARDEVVDKRVARKYLATEDEEDSRVKDHLASPGYN